MGPSVLLTEHGCDPTASFSTSLPPRQKKKVKINLIKVDSVHSKDNFGILPRVSSSASFVGEGTGFGAQRVQAGVLSLSCVTVGTSAKGAKVSLALQNFYQDMRERCKGCRVPGGHETLGQLAPYAS